MSLDQMLNGTNGSETHVEETTPAPEDVERVKGKWGEELNTAFQYDKYVGETRATGGWASGAPRYEWQEEFDGEDAIAPPDPDLEAQLFGEDAEGNMGINFDKYSSLWDFNLTVDTTKSTSLTGLRRKLFLS